MDKSDAKNRSSKSWPKMTKSLKISRFEITQNLIQNSTQNWSLKKIKVHTKIEPNSFRQFQLKLALKKSNWSKFDPKLAENSTKNQTKHFKTYQNWRFGYNWQKTLKEINSESNQKLAKKMAKIQPKIG